MPSSQPCPVTARLLEQSEGAVARSWLILRAIEPWPVFSRQAKAAQPGKTGRR
jgi:hypothetical protein